jgi:hypothetical protein
MTVMWRLYLPSQEELGMIKDANQPNETRERDICAEKRIIVLGDFMNSSPMSMTTKLKELPSSLADV